MSDWDETITVLYKEQPYEVLKKLYKTVNIKKVSVCLSNIQKIPTPKARLRLYVTLTQ